MAFKDYRKPISYIVDQELAKKKFIESNRSGSTSISGISFQTASIVNEKMPESPIFFVRDNLDRVKKIIYGNTEVEEEGMNEVGTEEFITDTSGRIIRIIQTYPSGMQVHINLNRNSAGKVEFIEGS